MKKSLHFLTLCVWLATQANVNAAPPTSGAYVDDRVNTYVYDEALESLGHINMILCVIGSFRAEQKVGAGNYNALVDAAKCEDKGDSGNAPSAGASAATDYLKVVVNSTRASNTAPPCRESLDKHDRSWRGGNNLHEYQRDKRRL
jgi:hypothetical protein